MSKTKCFACGKEMYVGGKTMEELLQLEMPVFCREACAESFPYHDTPLFDEKIIELKNKFTSTFKPEPLRDKLCRMNGKGAQKQISYFIIEDVKSAVYWLRETLEGKDYYDQRIIDDINQAFPDVFHD
jgi:hypothetical protein